MLFIEKRDGITSVTFDCIAIDDQTKQLHLLACHPAKAGEDLNQAGLRQIIRLHQGLKQARPELVIRHRLDNKCKLILTTRGGKQQSQELMRFIT